LTVLSPASSDEHRYVAGETTTLARELHDITRSAHLLRNLVHRDITIRYKRSVLGFFWTMLHPLLLALILMMVFSSVFRFAVPRYELYVLAALLPWNFFAQTTVGSMASLAWNGSLMKRVRVPKSIFTLSTVLAGLVNLALAYIPLVLIMLLRGAPIRPSIAFLPVSLLILALFTYGVSLLLTALAVYFVDVREMYNVALTALMYFTPVIYPIEVVPERFRRVFELNPLMYFIEIVRAPVHDGVLPSVHALVITSSCALAACVVGWLVFRRLSRGFYPYLSN
jgi:ABC-2 type transport system permease protein/lipopolysaccharide transport system permease protein